MLNSIKYFFLLSVPLTLILAKEGGRREISLKVFPLPKHLQKALKGSNFHLTAEFALFTVFKGI